MGSINKLQRSNQFNKEYSATGRLPVTSLHELLIWACLQFGRKSLSCLCIKCDYISSHSQCCVATDLPLPLKDALCLCTSPWFGHVSCLKESQSRFWVLTETQKQPHQKEYGKSAQNSTLFLHYQHLNDSGAVVQWILGHPLCSRRKLANIRQDLCLRVLRVTARQNIKY